MSGQSRTLILAVAWLWCLAAQAAPATPPKGMISYPPRPAPDLKVTDMDGQSFDLNKARGHWVLVHFWASWCGPCKRELPTIEKMIKQLQNTSLEVVLVNTAETEDTVFMFLPTVAPSLNTFMDPDGLITEKWQPRGLPASFLVDPKGMIRYVVLGGRDWSSKEYISFLRHLVDG